MSVSILYEDNHLIAVNKPAGRLVQGDYTGDPPISEDVKKYIKEKYQKLGNVFLGVIHRLDRPTSGIVIFAKTSKSLARMNQLFKEQKVKKIYWAVVKKLPEPTSGTIKSFTLKDKVRLKALVFDHQRKNAKESLLDYECIGQSESYFLLKIIPHTGRYHQIRSQLSHIGSPIKGDIKYGSKRTNPHGGIHLHAREIEFIHPISKEHIHIAAPTPSEDNLWASFENAFQRK